MTLAYSVGIHLFLIHVGDSRAYLFRRGQLQQLTRDHTVAQALADAGQINQDDVRRHPKRNTLTNYLGGHRGRVKADVRWLRLEDGDRVLLCSDGLSDMVEDPEIARSPGQAPRGRHGRPRPDAARTRARRQGQHHRRRGLLRHSRPPGRQAPPGRDHRTAPPPGLETTSDFPVDTEDFAHEAVGSRQ